MALQAAAMRCFSSAIFSRRWTNSSAVVTAVSGFRSTGVVPSPVGGASLASSHASGDASVKQAANNQCFFRNNNTHVVRHTKSTLLVLSYATPFEFH